MSIRVVPRTHKSAVAVAGMMVAAIALSGCSSLGSRPIGDATMTGSTAMTPTSTLGQPMPASLGAPPSQQLAMQQFLPPGNVGPSFGGGSGNTLPPAPVNSGWMQPASATSPIGMGAVQPSVQSQDLPVLSPSSSMGTSQAMPAQQSLAPLPTAPAVATLGASNPALPVNSSVPTPAPAANSNGAYTHTIASGESLYTIARRYDVTTQALVLANNLSSPDRITVGQSVIIPGRPDLAQSASATAAPTQVASANVQTVATLPTTPAPAATPAPVATPAATAPVATPAPAPTQVASAPAPAAEPAMSGNDRFGWPVSGRVITDFAASRGTGINIDVPAGSSVAAAENGTVIYVGSGVEGYGNLVLIRHPNGYVSAYAHLDSMAVARGANVSRGDAIGTVGQTGSVTRPQLHFELRRGATPVDPVPLLAS